MEGRQQVAQEAAGRRADAGGVLSAVFAAASGAGETLTATEKQVLRLLCADKSNAEIGEILGIKLATVKTHVSHVLSKLGVSRRSEAKIAAKKLRLIPDER